MATSSKQNVPLIEVYDYELASGDPSSATTSAGLAGKKVKITLSYDKALTISPDPVVWTEPEPVYTALTDPNGFWHVFLVPNNKISPANTFYTVQIEGYKTYQITVTDVGVPAIGWQSSAPGVLLNIPSALAPTTSTVGAITATGLITAQAGIAITAGGLTIAGGETDVGGLTVDTISYSLAVSRLIPGNTSFSIRNNANTADNLIVTDAGNATVRGSLTVSGGPLTVSAGGAAITGASTVTGTLTVSAALTVQAGGAAVTGNSTVTGTLTVSANLTISAGGLTVSGGGAAITGNSTVTGTLTVSSDITAQARLLFSTAVAKIIPGATSISMRNNADSADNVLVADAGTVTLRGPLILPPSTGGTAAATGYSTVPVKIAEVVLAAPAASISFSSIPSGFRTLHESGDIATTTGGNVELQLNADTGNNYIWILAEAGPTGAVAGISSGATAVAFMRLGFVSTISGANIHASFDFWIPNYAGTTFNKSMHGMLTRVDTTGQNTILDASAGSWQNSAAVNQTTVLSGGGTLSIASVITLTGEP